MEYNEEFLAWFIRVPLIIVGICLLTIACKSMFKDISLAYKIWKLKLWK